MAAQLKEPGPFHKTLLLSKFNKPIKQITTEQTNKYKSFYGFTINISVNCFQLKYKRKHFFALQLNFNNKFYFQEISRQLYHFYCLHFQMEGTFV
jgi:hypothetical protein